MIKKIVLFLIIFFIFSPFSVNAQNRCQAAVSTRIIDLTNLKAHLPDSQKPDLDSVISDLESQNTDCSLTTVINGYRIYSVVMPRNHLLASAQQLREVAVNLDRLYLSLSPVSDSDLLAYMKSKSESAKIQSQTIITAVSPLTSTGYNTNPQSVQTAFQTAHTALKLGISDVMSALDAARNIQLQVKTLKLTPSS